jgi:hypothetical protein
MSNRLLQSFKLAVVALFVERVYSATILQIRIDARGRLGYRLILQAT